MKQVLQEHRGEMIKDLQRNVEYFKEVKLLDFDD